MKRRYFVAFFVLLSLAAFASTAAGQEWIQLDPVGGPPARRAYATAVYDEPNDLMIVFGGYVAGAGASDDVWVLSNASGAGGTPQWSLLTPSGTSPGLRNHHTAVYDPETNDMIVFGGGGIGYDVWVLRNANGLGEPPFWNQLDPTGGPPWPGGGHSAVYNPSSNRMVVFGGCGWVPWGCDVPLRSEAWVLENANGLDGPSHWVLLSPGGGPPTRRSYHSGVYDPLSNRMVIFGGNTFRPDYTTLSDIWVLTDATGSVGDPQWIQITSGVDQPPRESHTAVYDQVTNRMVVFAGIGHGDPTNDVWVLAHANGLGEPPSFERVSAGGTLPCQRDGSAAVYSPATNRLVVFGGESRGTLLNDVWVLTNANGITNVAIDIKPGAVPNSINLGANGVVPVAVLTTPQFDASTVDGLTLALSGASVKLRGKSQEVGALDDVDDDGDLDLVVQFYINELELEEGATEATLTGKTKSGAEIMGKDSVRIVPE